MLVLFSGKWIITTIVFITDIDYQALTKIIFSHAAMVYYCKGPIDCIYEFWTISPIEILKMTASLLAKNCFTCHTNVPQISSKFPSYLIIVFAINCGVEWLFFSWDWICGSDTPDILQWHSPNGNEQLIIDLWNELTFITLTTMAIHYCLSAWKTGKFCIRRQISPGNSEQCKFDTRHNYDTLCNACTDVSCHRGADAHSS